ncbi:MAG: hypothetical protein LBK29_04100 [Oscillospiraceae bacterium]|jgi:hypothetical protein|nr:hypothetical protein [Oscillospiraceae bacterium]
MAFKIVGGVVAVMTAFMSIFLAYNYYKNKTDYKNHIKSLPVQKQFEIERERLESNVKCARVAFAKAKKPSSRSATDVVFIDKKGTETKISENPLGHLGAAISNKLFNFFIDSFLNYLRNTIDYHLALSELRKALLELAEFETKHPKIKQSLAA